MRCAHVLILALAGSLLACSPVQETRLVELSVAGPDGAVLTHGEADRALHVEVDDGSGWPFWVQLSQHGWTEYASTYQVPVGARLMATALDAPHPVAQREFRALVGNTPQRVELQLEPAGEERTLRIDLALPEEASKWRDYGLWIESVETGLPVDYASKDMIHRGIQLPPGVYQVTANGLFPAECAFDSRVDPEFAAYRLSVDLRKKSKAIRIRPKRGASLSLQVKSPLGALDLPPPRYRLEDEPWGQRTLELVRRPDWVRPKLVSVETGEEVPLSWHWPDVEAPQDDQRGVLLGELAIATNRVPLGTYELLIKGRSIEPMRQRIVVGEGEDAPVVLAPRAR